MDPPPIPISPLGEAWRGTPSPPAPAAHGAANGVPRPTDDEPLGQQHPAEYTPQSAVLSSSVLERLGQPSASAPSESGPDPQTMHVPQPDDEPPSPSQSLPAADDTACTHCGDSASSMFRPLVACRRCRRVWHRFCHAPAMDDVAVATGVFVCSQCLPLRPTAARWTRRAAMPPHDVSAWIASLSPQDMATQLVYAVEQHPDLAVSFGVPSVHQHEHEHQNQNKHQHQNQPTPTVHATPPIRYRNGIINSIRKSHAHETDARPPSTRRVKAEADTPQSISEQYTSPAMIPFFSGTPIDAGEEDPTGLMSAWPKPGRGLYAQLGTPDWDPDSGLGDTRDHVSFSSIVYDERGRKTRENGRAVLSF